MTLTLSLSLVRVPLTSLTRKRATSKISNHQKRTTQQHDYNNLPVSLLLCQQCRFNHSSKFKDHQNINKLWKDYPKTKKKHQANLNVNENVKVFNDSTPPPRAVKIDIISTKLQSYISATKQFIQTTIVPSIKRLPLYLTLFYILQEESISPLPIVIDCMYGPSMMPTIYTHDIYLRYRSLPSWLLTILSTIGIMEFKNNNVSYSKGDIVIIQDYKGTYACKRIIGIENDIVCIYGQFANSLYLKEKDFGIPATYNSYNDDGDGSSGSRKREIVVPPSWKEQQHLIFINEDNNDNEEEEEKQIHAVVKPNGKKSLYQLLFFYYQQQQQQNDNIVYNKHKINRKLKIPKDHIWVEGDNPLHSIDSRHYGPISLDNVHGKIIYRLWPRVRKITSCSCNDDDHHGDNDDECDHNDGQYLSCFVSKIRPKPLSEDEMKHLL